MKLIDRVISLALQPTLTMKYSLNLSLFVLIILIFSSAIYSQDFNITNYDISMDINTDGSLDIVENIAVNFAKKKRGIYRSIPYKYKKDGKTVKLGITDIEVDDYKHAISWRNGNLIIKIGDKKIYLEGDQQYTISYKIENGIQSYSEYQELYFDLIGNDWKTEINQLTYQINLPKSISINSDDLRSTIGYKNKNSEGLSIYQSTTTTIKGRTNRILKEGEGATIAIKFPKSYLSVAELANNGYRQKLLKEEMDKVPQNPWLVLIPMGLFGFFVETWRRIFGSKHKIDDQETYAYPPEGLTAAHVGSYVDQVSNTRDIVSCIPYWASEGYLKMDYSENDTLLTKTRDLPIDFPSYEHLLFNELFKDGDIRRISSLKEKFYTTLHQSKSLLTKEVHDQGYYKESYIYWFKTWRIVIFPFSMFVLAGVTFFVLQQIPMGIAFVVLGVVGLLFGLGKKPLSEYGKEVKYKLDGLKKFLEEVPVSEIESLVKHDPAYFEKMLPYAVAFGIEKNFIPKFVTAMNHMPTWYTTSTGTNSFSDFQNVFSAETISSAFSAAPANSSHSTSGGGFSSGGGIGGGGGGSW